MDETHGERLQRLRVALGHSRRPEFAELMGMQVSRLKNIERGSQKMNQDDFQKIAEHWPWALEYIAKGGQLVIPDDVASPVHSIVKSIEDVQKSTENLQLTSADDFAKAMTSNPEMKQAMESMMRNIMKEALNMADKQEEDSKE